MTRMRRSGQAVIVENNATEKRSPAARPQLISYRHTTPFPVGALLHFGPYQTFYGHIGFPTAPAI